MAKKYTPAGYGDPDAIRNVIKSHNTMLVSFPTELKLRAGLARGVTVHTDYSKEDPNVLIVTVQNPHDYSAELKAHLGKADARAQALKDKKERAATKVKRAKAKKETAEAKANRTPSQQEIAADCVKYGIDSSEKYYPVGWRKGDPYAEGHPMFEPPEAEAEAEPEPVEAKEEA